jgi:hypothetical protein
MTKKFYTDPDRPPPAIFEEEKEEGLDRIVEPIAFQETGTAGFRRATWGSLVAPTLAHSRSSNRPVFTICRNHATALGLDGECR